MPLSDWIVGSFVVPETTLTVTQGATVENYSLSAGSYYVWDDTASRSLIDSIAATINQHSLISDCAATLQENRLVSFSATPTFTVSFNDDTAREMAGFFANMEPASSTHTASAVSRKLWVPGRLSADDNARLGTQGNPVNDTAVGMSADGNVTATRHNTQRVNDMSWRYINTSRVHSVSEAGGELFAFFQDVLSRFYNFKIYRSFQNDEASSADVALNSPLGPYIWRKKSGKHQFNWSRDIKNVEKFGTFDLPIVSTAEY